MRRDSFNLLVRPPNWLGDTLMATASVAAIRRWFPKARLTLLAGRSFRDFWEDFPGVDETIVLEKGFFGFWRTVERLRTGGFDSALVLPRSFSSAFMVFAAGIPERIGWGGEGLDFLLTRAVPGDETRKEHLVFEYLELARRGLGLARPPAGKVRLVCPVTPEAERELGELFEAQGVPRGPYIGLAPGATYGPAKRWPLAYWKRLISRLLGEGRACLLILGGREEEEYLRPLLEGIGPGGGKRLQLLAGKTAPSVLAALLSRCELLVTNDTGPMHVAAAVGTPTVALFGSTSPRWTGPFGDGHEVVFHPVDCNPCFQRTCPIGYICLNGITVEEVHRAVLHRLASPRRVTGWRIPRRGLD
jgi:lipopolysaccharide heptosyltransferase II